MVHPRILTASLLVASAAVGSAQDVACQFLLVDMDLPGDNLPGSGPGPTTLEECILDCEKTDMCNAVVHNQEMTACFLKNVPDDVVPTAQAGLDSYILCSTAVPSECCAEGYLCCGYECVPETLMNDGITCEAVAEGCCPEPMDNCCDVEDSVCCDGMCFDTLTPMDVLNLDVCGDLSCCDVAFAPGPGPAMAPAMAPMPTAATRAPPPPPPAPGPDEDPEVGASATFGGADGLVEATTDGPPTNPEILNDEDFINEGIENCCPDGYFCCGLEIGCVPDEYAPEVACSVVGPDSPIPCCAEDY